MARQDSLLKLQKTLTGRRNELRKRIGMELDDIGDRNGDYAGGDAADAAFEATGEALSAQLAALEAKELAQIEQALVRIRQGKYGVCEGCNGKIPMGRLNALPYSTLCVACQSEYEKDASWLDDRIAANGNWGDVRDAGEEREVRLSDIEMDLSK